MSGLYNYRDSNFFIGGLNMFSFSAWTAGLVVFKEIYDYFADRKNELKVFAIMSVSWIFFMMIIEYIGYNILSIKLATDYAGFLGLPIMHMPWWGITYYFAAAPIFLLICKQMNVR
jgi:hypothetical protein